MLLLNVYLYNVTLYIFPKIGRFRSMGSYCFTHKLNLGHSSSEIHISKSLVNQKPKLAGTYAQTGLLMFRIIALQEK